VDGGSHQGLHVFSTLGRAIQSSVTGLGFLLSVFPPSGIPGESIEDPAASGTPRPYTRAVQERRLSLHETPGVVC